VIDYKREEEREREKYEEYLAKRRWQERRREEEQAEKDYWFQRMQHEQYLAKQAELHYAEQAQSYYLTLHIVHILRRYLNAITEKHEEDKPC
jgi:hypothetical protein